MQQQTTLLLITLVISVLMSAPINAEKKGVSSQDSQTKKVTSLIN